MKEAGFVDIDTNLEEAPTTLATEADYREFVTTVIYHPHLERLPDAALKQAFIDRVTELAAQEPVPFTLDYWRLNMQARKPTANGEQVTHESSIVIGRPNTPFTRRRRWARAPSSNRRGCWSASTRSSPGRSTRCTRTPGQDKVYQVIEGEGLFLLDGRELPMKAGDLLVAPEGVAHGVRNTGTGACSCWRSSRRHRTSDALDARGARRRPGDLDRPVRAHAAQRRRDDSFLHLPDLVFHEAGHIIFSPFGRFMTVLGGSLLQVLIPMIAAIAFMRQEEPFGAAICAWWAGRTSSTWRRTSPMRARCAGAARRPHRRRGRRPRLGIHPHAARRLHLDRQIGMTAYRLGMLIMVGALAFAARTILRRTRSRIGFV